MEENIYSLMGVPKNHVTSDFPPLLGFLSFVAFAFLSQAFRASVCTGMSQVLVCSRCLFSIC